jgi:hypothetical protein
LDLRATSAETSFASTSIGQHVDPLPSWKMLHPAFLPAVRDNRWNTASATTRIYPFSLSLFYRLFSVPRTARLRAWCAERLLDHKLPETMAPLPRNANGKVMKRQWREASAARQSYSVQRVAIWGAGSGSGLAGRPAPLTL